MLSAVTRVPATARYWPRSGDKASPRPGPSVRAELVQLNTRLLAMEREQRIQFERIAQLQHQLDELTRLVKKIVR
jgi:hypothetical protein